MSRWTLKTEQFGRSWEFSWLAQNLTPIRYQKIHWRSVPGSVQGSIGGSIEVTGSSARHSAPGDGGRLFHANARSPPPPALAQVPNRGEIRFYRKGGAECAIKLTISYEVPQVRPRGGAWAPAWPRHPIS